MSNHTAAAAPLTHACSLKARQHIVLPYEGKDREHTVRQVSRTGNSVRVMLTLTKPATFAEKRDQWFQTFDAAEVVTPA